jgi:hypothetical protein
MFAVSPQVLPSYEVSCCRELFSVRAQEMLESLEKRGSGCILLFRYMKKKISGLTPDRLGT